MRITQVVLDNIKSYKHVAIPLKHGTTAIRGSNGAGKSTLVEAIGFALFDAIYYKQAQFVREGEKTGQVTVSFISALDDREYDVVRRCGNSSDWYVFDPELHDRVVEQRADVLAFLRQHLRIEGEVALSDLFSDAIGVTQGTFTADFLETPGQRKKKFDALLQVEEYATAASKLNDTQKYLVEQKHQQELRISALEYETGQLDGWREELATSQAAMRQAARELDAIAREADDVARRRNELRDLEGEVTRLAGVLRAAEATQQGAEMRWHEARRRLDDSRAAVRTCEATRGDFQAYQRAEAGLAAARERQRERDRFLQQQASVNTQVEGAKRDHAHTQKRLATVTEAERKALALAPDVARQAELEQQRTQAQARVQELRSAEKSKSRVEADIVQVGENIAKLQADVAELDALRPEAAHLSDRRARLEELQAAATMRAEREKRLKAIGLETSRVRQQRERAASELTRAQENLRKLDALEEKVAAQADLEREHGALERQVLHLEATLQSHRQSRQQSGQGQCPFLAEPCLNIQRRGVNSLATYFDQLIERDEAALAPVQQRLVDATGQLNRFREMTQLLAQRSQYEAWHNREADSLSTADEQLAQLADERAAIEQALADAPDAQTLREARDLYAASDAAEKRLTAYPMLRAQLDTARQRHTALVAELEAVEAQVRALSSSPTMLDEAVAALAALGDPRTAQQAALQIAEERASLEQRLGESEEALRSALTHQAALDEALRPFATLDAEIAALDAEQTRARPGAQAYLRSEQQAAMLPQVEAAEDALRIEATSAADACARARDAHTAAAARFDAGELARLNARAEELSTQRGQKAQVLAHLRDMIEELEANITRCTALLDDLRAARDEYQTLTELEVMLKQFRDTIKEAGPNIMRALLHQISLEANRVFGEILGDRSAQLLWQDDYEIVLRRDGRDRSFAQLSGGEQMSAALAVRLALLRNLSGLDIAFFDEPTTNMDGERRGNLAEQIRRVRGFDQILVISHDDTFEQGLDDVIHLEKRNGETVLVEDESLVLA